MGFFHLKLNHKVLVLVKKESHGEPVSALEICLVIWRMVEADSVVKRVQSAS